MKAFSMALSLLVLCSVPVLAAPSAAPGSPAAKSTAAKSTAAGAELADEKACRKFVQEFYDWYLKQSKRDDNKDDPSSTALKTRKDSFDPPLIKKLEEDEAASAKSPDEIVGLDFDPFMNAQDVPESYTTGKVARKGQSYLVEVYGKWTGDNSKNRKPDVRPELVYRNNHFVFVNFLYPPSDIPVNADLISVLNELKRSRDEDKKSASNKAVKSKTSSSAKSAASKPAGKSSK